MSKVNNDLLVEELTFWLRAEGCLGEQGRQKSVCVFLCVVCVLCVLVEREAHYFWLGPRIKLT